MEKFDLDKKEIKELIKLVEDSDISELEVSDGKRNIRIAKGGMAPAVAVPAVSPAPAASAAPPAADAPESGEEALASNLKQVVSPMVGTFYRSPAPGADAFVEVGQTVSVGQTVCIVEAMKLMNEIGSDFGGIVRKILVENAQPIEYGQPLFLVETK